MSKLLSETTLFESRPDVDAAGGVIRGAKLIGLVSKNGRRYEHRALANAVGLYEGRKVYVDHPRPDDAGADRSWDRWAGVLENCQVRADGVYGDVVLRKESTYFAGILEAATNPKFYKECGFSHVADGESRMAGDTEIVESIREVFSVDLVTDPATTKGFFESSRQNMKKPTLRQVVENLDESNVFRSRLIEAMETGLFDGGIAVGAEGNDALSQISNALQKVLDALVKIVGTKDMADAAKNQSNATQADPTQADPTQADPSQNGKPKSDPNALPGIPAEDQQKRIESLERKLALADARNALIEAKIEPTEIRVKLLAETTDAADRKALVESWPQKTAAAAGSGDNYWPESSPPASGGGGESKYPEHWQEARKRAEAKLRG